MHARDPQGTESQLGARQHCVSCQAPLNGAFCAQCGEKVVTHHDYSLSHFFEHALESLTHFDFKVFRSLWILIKSPGQLTLDYLQGRRKQHLPPVQLFVLINIAFVFFIHAMGASPFNTPMKVQQTNPPYAEYKLERLQSAIASSGLTEAEFERAFNKAADFQAKTWIISFIPVFALVFAGLHLFRRYYFEMLIYATHYWSFLLLWIMVVLPLWRLLGLAISALAGAPLEYSEDQFLSGVLVLAGIATWQYKTEKRALGAAWWTALLRVLATCLLFFSIVQYYRLMLFFLSLWAM